MGGQDLKKEDSHRKEKSGRKKSVHKQGEGSGPKRGGQQWKLFAVALLAVAAIGLAAFGIHQTRQGQDGGGQTAGQKGPEDGLAIEETIDGEEGAGQQPEEEAHDSAKEEAEPELSQDLQALVDRGVPIPEKEVDFEDLQENVNADIYAWIYIPDSEVDYPILQHPYNDLYYLNYNLDGSYGYPGCIYTERYNGKDFSDPVTVVYGHNMKNGTMFAGLHDYEDMEYFREHPYVYVYTPERLFAYQIFAAYESGNEHLLYGHDYALQSEFEKYMERVEKVRGMNCNRAEDVEVEPGNHILVLSTCIANKPDNRYLVQGVLLNEE